MLNRTLLSNSYADKAALAFMFFVLLIGLNCGKRKPPLPPIEKVSQRIEISGIQRGNIVSLSWTLPDGNASKNSLLNINRADVYRLAESLSAPAFLSEEEFASRSTLISSVPISKEDFDKKQFVFNDTLQFAGQPARLRYAVRFVNEAGQKAAFSNFLLIEPTARLAEQPSSLSAKVSEAAIMLRWQPPLKNVDGSQPVNLLGYNIYRTDNEETKILNKTTINTDDYKDAFFEFGKKYKYYIRTVSLGIDGNPVESLDSNTVEVNPIDTFPPKPPGAITIAAAPKTLSLFFAVNVEKDVVGYKIYRTSNPNQPKSEWQLMTPELLTGNTFQDSDIESGKTYYYYLTAVDSADNKSEPSETVSETAP